MDDVADLFQRRVGGQAEGCECGFERAPVLVVPERSSAHVERCGVGGDGCGVGGEDEFCLGVDEAADQPCARGPVDVDTGPGGPLHASVLAVLAAARWPTARRAASLCGQVKKSRAWMRCSSRRSRVTARLRAAASAMSTAAASAVTASYSAATAAVIRLTITDAALTSSGRPRQSVASPPWS